MRKARAAPGAGRGRPGALGRACLAGACLVLAGACGAGSAPAGRSSPAALPPGTGQAAPPAGHPPAAASPTLDGCFPAAGGREESVPGADGGTLTLGILGTGRRVVILSNESDEDLCSWLPFARRLAAAGYRTVLWDYGANPPQEEVSRLARAFRRAAAVRIVLMGASEGAKASLVAAAQLRPPVQGVVSLSAEEVLAPGILVARLVARLRSPLLLVTAAHDPFGSAPAAREFLRAAPTTDKRIMTVPGAGHGTALLAGPAGAKVVPAVLAFLRRAFAR